MVEGAAIGTTLVLGGARSGKSAFAESAVMATGLSPVYIATAQGLDEEMRDRIAAHRVRRGTAWRTIEAPLALVAALNREAVRGSAVLVDCLTLWLTNLLLADADVETESARLVEFVGTINSPVVMVANEVGLGIVPDNALARRFRDHAGKLNQAIAARSSSVYFLAAGLPMRLKPGQEPS